jgi:transposase
MLDHKFEPTPSATRRVEVFIGTGRRRRWPPDAKARILEEALATGVVASAVARRHGITPQQLFGWRRTARRRASEEAAGAPGFAPVMLEAPADAPRPREGAALEILIGPMLARIPLTADAATLARIVRALKEAT